MTARTTGFLAESARDDEEDEGGREAVAVILGGISVIMAVAVVAGVVMLARSVLS